MNSAIAMEQRLSGVSVLKAYNSAYSINKVGDKYQVHVSVYEHNGAYSESYSTQKMFDTLEEAEAFLQSEVDIP